MAQLYVSNINFESTGNNQLFYSTNIVSLKVGGTNNAVTFDSNGVNFNVAFGNSAYDYVSNSVATVNNSITVTGAFITSGNVTPTAFTANTADWAPGVGNTYLIRVSANTSTANNEYLITGMTAGVNGQIVVLNNNGSKSIWIRNEESGSNGAIIPGVNVPSSTAANRFNMPNHLELQGYQSAKFYYDGTLARWKLIDSVDLPFDYKKGKLKGFFSGGFASPVAVATADKTTYSTETTAAVTGANLSQARCRVNGVSNACKGFLSGGNAPTAVATADRTNFSLETTAAVTGANLITARGNNGTAGNACKGFFTSNTFSCRTTFSTESTASVPGSILSAARIELAGGGNSDKGFFAGGGTVATADRNLFSTETTVAVTGANLTQARAQLGAAANQDKMFFSGGSVPTPVAGTQVVTTDRTTFSTETTAAVPGANLSALRRLLAGSGNSCKGFMGGGVSTPANIATTDRTTYSTETTAAVVGANLSQIRTGYGSI